MLSDVRLIGPPLALAVLAMGKDRPPQCWLWVPGLNVIAPLPAFLLSSTGWWGQLVLALDPAVFLGMLGVILLWLVVDARPAIAFGMYFELIYVLRSFAIAPRLSDAPTAGQGLIIALLAAALAGAALRVRRMAIH